MDSRGLVFIALSLALASGSVLERHNQEADLYDAKTSEIADEQVTYEGAQIWRIQASDKSEFLDYLRDRGDLTLWSGNDSVIDALVLPDVIARVSRFLHQRHIDYDVVIPDLQQAINHENPEKSQEEIEELEGRNARYAWWKASMMGMRRKYAYNYRYPIANSLEGEGDRRPWQCKGHRMEWSTYHGLEDIYGYLDYLNSTYSEICSVNVIGYSVEGRPLKVLRISKGVEDAPAIWIDGGIHAREWISPAVVTYLIDYLVEHADKSEVDYYILPVVNPDGYRYTFRGDRLWRKNRGNREKGGACVGVDLNRNFRYKWGGMGTSRQPCREIFAGSGPFSEPETASIERFFENTGANFKAYLTFHSYGQYILYPWGYDRRVPPDHEDLNRVGRRMAAAMRLATDSRSEYTVGNSATTLYAAAGGADDWAKAYLKIKYTYTIELRDRGQNGFVLPAAHIKPTALEGLAAVKVVTEEVLKLRH